MSIVLLPLAPPVAGDRLTGDGAALLLSCVTINAVLGLGSALIILRPSRFRVALMCISVLRVIV
ncbi:hypothetical protein [Gordonia hydrophobica]|uniref:Uncharacterized protein n=1 Tax=Gordonia hydrophobica TaxID=40516 RepID=A0ABZ2U6P0_9ACTN|nr:hypothetical protein [Gordonia hydrophobica]MBM7369538.1 hypothetical protein [Gordonia hydrophobica]